MAVSMPIPIEDFDKNKQLSFKTAVATTAGVSATDVSISNIASITPGVSRRLLTASTRVDVNVNAATRSASALLENRLANANVLNANLQQAGLPQATVFTMPKSTQIRPVSVILTIDMVEDSEMDTWYDWLVIIALGFIVIMINSTFAACIYTQRINQRVGQHTQILTHASTISPVAYHQIYDLTPSAPPHSPSYPTPSGPSFSPSYPTL